MFGYNNLSTIGIDFDIESCRFAAPFGTEKYNDFMIFNDDILYIHIGKTGGMSTARYLCKVLKDPIYNVVPPNALDVQFGNAKNIAGLRHETLEEALEVTRQYGKGIGDFKEVLATIRHPYDLELSLYFHLKKKLDDGRKVHPERAALVREGIESFVKAGIYHRPGVRYEDYVTIEGQVPNHLRFIRFENISEEFQKISVEYGSGKRIPFPHRNKSKRSFTVNDLSDELKALIYEKYKWIFDQGFYER